MGCVRQTIKGEDCLQSGDVSVEASALTRIVKQKQRKAFSTSDSSTALFSGPWIALSSTVLDKDSSFSSFSLHMFVVLIFQKLAVAEGLISNQRPVVRTQISGSVS